MLLIAMATGTASDEENSVELDADMFALARQGVSSGVRNFTRR
jgi:hypothetical protein